MPICRRNLYGMRLSFEQYPTLICHRGMTRLALGALVALWLALGALAAGPPRGSREGIVVAASPEAARVGAEVLEGGGNAVDAAVATAFALMVAEPGYSGLGGRAVMLVGSPGGRVEGLEGGTRWPGKWVALRKAGATVSPPRGWGQIAVPGALAALTEAEARWGARPLRDVIRPAVALARGGFVVSRVQERQFAAYDWTRAGPELRAIFLHPDGTPYRAGERLRQPELARALERIARDGAEVFYRGEIGRAIVAAMERHGGYVTAEDLASYQPRPAVIDPVPYRSFRIAAPDRPTMGRLLGWRLRVLEKLPRYDNAVDDAQAVAELLAAEPPVGPAGESDAAQRERLLAGDGADVVARRIAVSVRDHVVGRLSPGATPAVTHTTHLVTADRTGRVVSLTQTLGPAFGADVVLPGWGITFAATMGYMRDTDVSQEPISAIAPTLVFDAAGRPVMALGAAGGLRIPEILLQVLHNALDRSEGIAEAVAAPRLSLEREGGATLLRMEGMENPAVQGIAAGLRARGFDVRPATAAQLPGRVHALMRRPDGTWIGAADPRWFGEAVAVREMRADGGRDTRGAGGGDTGGAGDGAAGDGGDAGVFCGSVSERSVGAAGALADRAGGWADRQPHPAV